MSAPPPPDPVDPLAPTQQLGVDDGNETTDKARHEESFQKYREAIRLAAEIPLPQAEQAAVTSDYGTALAAVGRYAEAEAQMAQSAALFASVRCASVADRITGLVNVGIMRANQGRPAEALRSMEEGAALLERHPGLESFRVWAGNWRARTLLDLGRVDEAEALFRAVVAMPAELDAASHPSAQAGLAQVLVLRGRASEALAAAERAVAADNGASATTRAHVRFALAQALRAAGGDQKRALEAARQALDGFQGPEDGHRRGQIQAWLDQGAFAEKGFLLK